MSGVWSLGTVAGSRRLTTFTTRIAVVVSAREFVYGIVSQYARQKMPVLAAIHIVRGYYRCGNVAILLYPLLSCSGIKVGDRTHRKTCRVSPQQGDGWRNCTGWHDNH